MTLSKRTLLLIILLAASHLPVAQNLDSLQGAFRAAKNDTSRLLIEVEIEEAKYTDRITYWDSLTQRALKLNLKKVASDATSNIGFIYYNHGDIPKAIEFYRKSIKIDEQTNNKSGMATTLNNIASIYQRQGDIPMALENYNQSLKICTEIKDRKGMATAIYNIGTIYEDQGDITKALDHYIQSLKIDEEIKEKQGIAANLNNIGLIYSNQGDNLKALDYYIHSLAIRKEINDKQGMATSLANIASVYRERGDISMTLIYAKQSLKILEDIDDKHGIAISLANLGGYFKDQGDMDKAMDYYMQSLKKSEEINDKDGISNSLNNLAAGMLKQGKMDGARTMAEHSLKLSRELGYPENIIKASNTLSKIYSKTGNWQGAYEMQVLFKQMADSINNENTRKASIKKGFQYAYEKKAAADSVKAKAEHKVFEARSKQEKTQRMALYLGISLIAVFSVFMYNRFRVTRNQKGIIEVQKSEVDKQRELADSRRIIAEEQRYVIQEKQKEILDSIQYASRIQGAMLTSEEYISQNFKADYFIFYQPKDIVSGDFYWAVKHDNLFYMATSDCTGHGVPGAFMSLLNISFLNETVIERGIAEPAKILDEQRTKIIKALNPKGNENSKDGMDCVLCAFDLLANKLDFAASNNPLWHIRNKQLTEYKADKMPVGKGEDNAKGFTHHSIDLQKGDLIYTFTDGYADQFGGPKGKKFMYKQFSQLILENHHLPLAEQRVLFEKTINAWKGSKEQVDDILVIGVRI